MNDSDRRDMWAGRIERCLAADMTIKEWCTLNKVAESSLYKWMARFREEDPDRFPRRSSEASNWIKMTRCGMSGAVAIVPAAGAAEVGEPVHHARHHIHIQEAPGHARRHPEAGLDRRGRLRARPHGRRAVLLREPRLREDEASALRRQRLVTLLCFVKTSNASLLRSCRAQGDIDD